MSFYVLTATMSHETNSFSLQETDEQAFRNRYVLMGEVLHDSGILQDYTSEFIEILDVDYRTTDDHTDQKADLVVSRRYGVIRHLGA